MMADAAAAQQQPTTAPVLSTPETHLFEDPTPPADPPNRSPYSEQELWDIYEIERTAREVVAGGWKVIALQFPDHMLYDAPRVFEGLNTALQRLAAAKDIKVEGPTSKHDGDVVEEEPKEPEVEETAQALKEVKIKKDETSASGRYRLCILGDTSYGACCVDEVAAEHINAEVVVHYGRSCLSPTARLPVIYVFTTRPLKYDDVVLAFENTYAQKDVKVVFMADLVYSKHVPALYEKLVARGYSNIHCPEVVHDPSSLLPNRTVPSQVASGEADLKDFSLFHIGDPAQSLLLTLSSRLDSMYIYPAEEAENASAPIAASSAAMMRPLRRRYGMVTSLSTCGVFGLLINTLSVKNYLSAISSIQAQIAAAGKKSYTFVVGKVNAAKVANFSDIGAWVVVGCWESSLIDSSDFFRPIITPFELQLCLMPDSERIWTGEWRGDFASLLAQGGDAGKDVESKTSPQNEGEDNAGLNNEPSALDDEEESLPPEFDLRTGRYVSHSRPMAVATALASSSTATADSKTDALTSEGSSQQSQNALTRRANGTLATIRGTVSPGAEYLRTQRTWRGLGSDFDFSNDAEDDEAQRSRHGVAGALVEEGRSGIARGYTVGSDDGHEKK